MVGRPGRSKGCHTCRQRKKGCDLRRPFCRRCAQSNIICEGYDQCLTIIPHEPDAASESTTAMVRRVSSGQRDHFQPLHDGLVRSAFEIRTFDRFWELHMPKNVRVKTSTQKDLKMLQWVEVSRDCYTQDEVLRCAFLAVSMARIGQGGQDLQAVEQGFKLYGKALREMNRALQDRERQQSDEVLAACKLLAIYEILQKANSTPVVSVSQGLNWRNHSVGIQRLVELRGPEKHVDGTGHGLFIGIRIAIIVSSITSRRRTYLSNPEWKTIPWSSKPKSIRDELVDIMADIPTVLEKFDNLGSYSDTIESFQGRILLNRECLDLDGALQVWCRKMAAMLAPEQTFDEAANPDAETIHSLLDQFNTESLYEYGFGLAYTLVLYWTTCILLYGTMHLNQASINRASQTLPDSRNLPKAPPLWADPRHYAEQIAQSATYFFDPDQGTVCAQLFTFPMGIALQYLAAAGMRDSEAWHTLTKGFKSPLMGPSISGFLTTLLWSTAGKSPPNGAQDFHKIRETSQKWFESTREEEEKLG